MQDPDPDPKTNLRAKAAPSAAAMSHARRGGRERKCPFCQLNFTKEEHLARHIRTHTKEKPFGCSACGKMFTRQSHQPPAAAESSKGRSPREAPGGKAGEERPDSAQASAEAVSALLDIRHHSQPSTSSITTHAHPEPRHQLLHSSQPSTQLPLPLPPPQAHPPPPPPAPLPPAQQQHYEAVPVVSPTTLPPRSSPAHTAFPNIPASIWYTPPSAAIPSDSEIRHQPSITPGPLPGLERDPSGDVDYWSALSANIPGWFVGDDFDLAALNSTMPTTMEWPEVPHNVAPPMEMDTSEPSTVPTPSITEAPRPERREDIVRRTWFTFLEADLDTPAEALPEPERMQVDDRYRENLSRQLQQHVPSDPLPSTDFLNLCIQMYFTRFDSIFPIVHAPTFRPSKRQSLLLLSMCSVGSLFLGSPHGMSQGRRIFEQLNKAILASWETYMARGSGEALAMTQATLIGQTFGMLSGSPRHLAIVQAFHGTVIAWARRHRMFNQETASNEILNLIDTDVDKAWRLWVSAEEKIRISIGLRIHDCELAELFMAEPFLRSSQSRLPRIASQELWTAPNAHQWSVIFKKQQAIHAMSTPSADSSKGPDSISGHSDDLSLSSIPQPTNWLVIYAVLEGHATMIIEHRSSETLGDAIPKIQDSLIHIFDEHLRTYVLDSLCLLSLWHSVFISLFCDLNRLEIAVGREGFEQAQLHLPFAREWASSIYGHRCALHAALILRRLENLPISTEPAIHVPRLLYRCALIWFVYTKFGHDQDAGAAQQFDFPELKKLSINPARLLFEVNGFKRTRPVVAECRTLCCLVDLLQRSSHWEINRKMAALLRLLMYGPTDE